MQFSLKICLYRTLPDIDIRVARTFNIQLSQHRSVWQYAKPTQVTKHCGKGHARYAATVTTASAARTCIAV